MDDLISRAAAIKGLLSMCPEKTEPGSFNEYGVTVLCGAVDVVIKALPAVDAAPVVHGRWVKVSGYVTPGGDPVWKCSECGKGVHVYGIEHGTYGADIADGQWISCPNCGAKMDGEADG